MNVVKNHLTNFVIHVHYQIDLCSLHLVFIIFAVLHFFIPFLCLSGVC